MILCSICWAHRSPVANGHSPPRRINPNRPTAACEKIRGARRGVGRVHIPAPPVVEERGDGVVARLCWSRRRATGLQILSRIPSIHATLPRAARATGGTCSCPARPVSTATASAGAGALLPPSLEFCGLLPCGIALFLVQQLGHTIRQKYASCPCELMTFQTAPDRLSRQILACQNLKGCAPRVP
jgi:hypothetical protein